MNLLNIRYMAVRLIDFSIFFFTFRFPVSNFCTIMICHIYALYPLFMNHAYYIEAYDLTFDVLDSYCKHFVVLEVFSN